MEDGCKFKKPQVYGKGSSSHPKKTLKLLKQLISRLPNASQ